jgi:hypothetical protein
MASNSMMRGNNTPVESNVQKHTGQSAAIVMALICQQADRIHWTTLLTKNLSCRIAVRLLEFCSWLRGKASSAMNKRTWDLLILLAGLLFAAVFFAYVYFVPRCNAQSLKGPTIGGVVQISGCY